MTHYTADNPPPKQVQGYKFTIFYPDLLNKYETPRFSLHAANESEFAIIKFHAGTFYSYIILKNYVQKIYDIYRTSI